MYFSSPAAALYPSKWPDWTYWVGPCDKDYVSQRLFDLFGETPCYWSPYDLELSENEWWWQYKKSGFLLRWEGSILNEVLLELPNPDIDFHYRYAGSLPQIWLDAFAYGDRDTTIQIGRFQVYISPLPEKGYPDFKTIKINMGCKACNIGHQTISDEEKHLRFPRDLVIQYIPNDEPSIHLPHQYLLQL